MNDALLRQLTVDDLPALAELEANCFNPPWSDSQLHSYIVSARCLSVGLWQDGQLGCFAMLSTVLDEAELLQIAVRTDLRGRGLAGRVLQFAHQQLQQRGIVRNMLEVRSSNAPAISLYRRLGYQQDGVRKGYYPTATGREDAVLMSCNNLNESLAE
ncbi:ribosomal protein S18-alanine N-acetyltransferase [Amphritea japonica]|uniref:Ribosomal-protein-alanine N-acetyltransferase n=1 Tax=Amphritea japonica ATCC BAA-1530 TaxID=1278309 RepID=A0A7R6P9H9_9GAMM|nr:ribosomal protein S18-alanine N-acetyltransferase [Amphritea japonica]BBB25056.1 ribosomal-protein-alanine N-acetyltransferase [Amphritea japonica ATCC BAA-1530]